MYSQTKTYLNALESQNDGNDQHRELIANNLDKFRMRVGDLIQTIPSDVPGLTVHDLSHMDALWNMIDILTEGKYDLNPAEVFVLGGAILLHDSGMTVHAYVNGIEEIKESNEYIDALEYFKVNSEIEDKSTADFNSQASAYAISDTLRLKHAEKAELLASQKWKNPLNGDEVYLIDDIELREHFGHSIGKIAHSHHWDIAKVSSKLLTAKGAYTKFPSGWTVNEVKLALLLRCSDAMHLDDRRAPTFTSAIRDIGSTSVVHWKFQNKLGQPSISNGKLLYTSKSPFLVEDAPAWNLCFDTLQSLDKELRDAADLHQNLTIQQFAAHGVVGAGSPESLASSVQVEGWRPLPLSLQVSDVPSLALTLGGKDLYSFPLTPIRELIQNAADAIEARSVLEDDFTLDDGEIVITVQQEDDDVTVIHVSDNGVGMSESVLTKALLDFGLSFWKSSAARSEFPGLQKHTNRFRGRYGIGFFSVFMWSNSVQVSSRRFEEGIGDAKTLEFKNGMNSRPILRPSSVGERSSKWNTRVSLKIDTEKLNKILAPRHENFIISSQSKYKNIPTFENKISWVNRLKKLCGPLQIKVLLIESNDKTEVSLPSWKECSPKQFFDFFEVLLNVPNKNRISFIDTLSPVTYKGDVVGRCLTTPYYQQHTTLGVYDKGIFVTQTSSSGFYGILEAKTTNAARDRLGDIPYFSSNSDWMDEVMKKSFELCSHVGEKIKLQVLFLQYGLSDKSQPEFFMNRSIVSYNGVCEYLKEYGRFSIRLRMGKNSIGSRVSWEGSDDVSVFVGLDIDEDRIFPIAHANDKYSEKNSTYGYIQTEMEIGVIANDIREFFINHQTNLLASVFESLCIVLGENVRINTKMVGTGRYDDFEYMDVYVERV